MQSLKVILIIFEVVLLFNLLIFVHEWGHFLAAKWRGLKIERFAIWFGKPIWKKEINGVQYALGWIPAGGYVSLPQMAPMEMLEGKSETPVEQLAPISALDKIIVAFAGPLFSFGLAIVFAGIIALVGRPLAEVETTTTIGHVVKGSPADKANLQVGDRILEVDNKPVSKFGGMGDSVRWRIVRSEGDTIPIKVQRDKEQLTVNCGFSKRATGRWERKALRQIGIAPAYSAIISEVLSNSPAAKATTPLLAGDQITAVNGKKLYSPESLIAENETQDALTLTLTGRRHGQEFESTLNVPASPNATNMVESRDGIIWVSGGKIDLVHPGVFEQIRGSVEAMVSTFGALFSRKSDIKAQHLAGPLKILNIYYQLFQDENGWRLVIWFSVILNVNLGLLNLLPIPVLDGGHITLALVEAVRRKPINVRVLSVVQTSCALAIICYMLYILFYDVQDSNWSRAREKPVQQSPAPPGQGQPAPKP